jgi:hypothetical protein
MSRQSAGEIHPRNGISNSVKPITEDNLQRDSGPIKSRSRKKHQLTFLKEQHMRFTTIRTVAALLATVVFTISCMDRPTIVTPPTTTVPHYNHILVLVEENQGYEQIIGNSHAPIINQLARTYGLATHYTGVGDPSAPNYVAILGGNTYGIADDNAYYTHTIRQPSLVDQLEGAGLSWKGYFQSMPYPGFKGLCFPVKCDGAPDISPLYAAKHNGFPYFAHIQQDARELRKMVPMTELDQDLQSGQLPNFSFIVPDQCHDMHGAPPFCVDDGTSGSVTDNFLVGQGDTYAGSLMKTITSSSLWSQGNNALVITWDEGDMATSRIVTIVITNHGPRGLQDGTPYTHYSLLLTIEESFGLGCLQHTCDARTVKPMVPLFAITKTAVTAPSDDTSVSSPPVRMDQMVVITSGTDVVPSGMCGGWSVVHSPNGTTGDNALGAVAAVSSRDVWAVGNQTTADSAISQTLIEHWDGTRWRIVPSPNDGVSDNFLLGVTAISSGDVWAVGNSLNSSHLSQVLIEHWDGTRWRIVPSPNPGSSGNFLFGAAAVSPGEIWAVGFSQDSAGSFSTLIERWDGTSWQTVKSPNPGSSSNLLYGIAATSSRDIWAVGQDLGASSPDETLLEHWDGSRWSVISSPATGRSSGALYGVAALASSSAWGVGNIESDGSPLQTLSEQQSAGNWSLVSSPNTSVGDNKLFAVSAVSPENIWAVGNFINADGNAQTLVEQWNGTHWVLVQSPSPGSGDNILGGIAAITANDVWAVGGYDNGNGTQTLIEHFC